jgi:two-component system response regulator YesN
VRSQEGGKRMGLYRVLLADDEAEIREGMIERIDWKSLGFEIVASAENGLEALELLEQTNPDIIITDIKMPFLNGLQFVERAVKILPAVKIIIFSGFDDFEYARKAIRLNVEEYLLKPISANQISETLTHLKEKIDAEIEEKRNIDTLQKNYMENLPIIKENFLMNWIEGHIGDEEIKTKAIQYHISINEDLRTVIIFDIDKTSREKNDFFKGKEELIPIAVKRIVDKALGRFPFASSFIYQENVVVIAGLEEESQSETLLKLVNEVCKEGRNITELKITAGVGGLYRNLEAVKLSYKEAREALGYGELFNKDGGYTTFIGDIERARQLAKQGQADSGKQIALKAKQYVEENYADDLLSVEKICGELYLSQAYFSTVFKKEEKINFVSYLTNVRLEHAIKLLETTADKTYVIAAKVGYADPNYFSYVFRKKYGMSPSKYRSSM